MDITNYGFKFDKFDDEFSFKLIKLAFDHYDLYINVLYVYWKAEEYEERRESFFTEFSKVKPTEIKTYLISIIDSIDKLYNTEDKYIEDSLLSIFSMSDKQIHMYKLMLQQNNEKIQRFKLNLLGKAMKSRILDFSYNFNIRYAEKNSDKVDFAIKILIKFINDQGNEDKMQSGKICINKDLTINQFYSLFNEFQKIETMIKTLAN